MPNSSTPSTKARRHDRPDIDQQHTPWPSTLGVAPLRLHVIVRYTLFVAPLSCLLRAVLCLFGCPLGWVVGRLPELPSSHLTHTSSARPRQHPLQPSYPHRIFDRALSCVLVPFLNCPRRCLLYIFTSLTLLRVILTAIMSPNSGQLSQASSRPASDIT